jgi:hypothetical protein
MPARQCLIRKRIADLGQLSRPLGEANARRLAACLARDVTSAIRNSEDPKTVFAAYECEIRGALIQQRAGSKSARDAAVHAALPIFEPIG